MLLVEPCHLSSLLKGKTSKSLHGFNTSAVPFGTKWFMQKNGWMTDSIGERWFEEVFLAQCGDQRPQLLLDGHSSQNLRIGHSA